MTLMPVSKISTLVALLDERRRRRGESAMGFLAPTGPRSSTGSPMTFRMRPSVSGPTGIRMGAPVFFTAMPRTRPSVESMAIARTVRFAQVLRDLEHEVVRLVR